MVTRMPIFVIFVPITLIFISLDIGYCQDFGYEGSEGPTFWGEKYSNCIGKLQSPIDIEEDNIKVVQFDPLIFENFEKPLQVVKLTNNGHTVMLSVTQGKSPKIYGGPLKGEYKFAQLHFHWGTNDTEGSENTINHQRFPLELHMVFFNTQYEDFNNAINFGDGLSVLSFLYSVRETNNSNYEGFEFALGKVREAQSSTDLDDFVSLDEFTTMEREAYFTYEGSLTTPPCSEVVIWIEFKNTIPLSSRQIEAFRHLSNGKGQLSHNFRPVQPTNDRIIYMNAQSESAATITTNNYFTMTILLTIVCNI
ncbi:carbonic anhydrase 2-like [Cylas formicarius]|uniref:carbonic anhydrase 2-like n=1 Tax=Cylas formicarius TaxID=197179 RepID=UPI002958CADA|nr:carbonic anhydrase 2-like [Cylas formicarius]